nr:MAG TPA: hypothetical protein [Bacteriophage sp.]
MAALIFYPVCRKAPCFSYGDIRLNKGLQMQSA